MSVKGIGLKFDAIFFDFDGVMAETMPYHLTAWKDIIENHYGFEFRPMTVKLNEGRPVVGIARAVFEEAGRDYSESQLLDIIEKKNAVFRATNNATIYPENFEIIKLAQDKGLKVGLVTGTHLKNVEALLPKEMMANFDVIIVDGDAERGKPFPDPYLTAARRCGVDPEKCIVVENAPMGVQAAKSAGMFCAALKTTLSSEHLKAADVTFDNHAQLLTEIRDVFLA
jgi:beta-phosphoglucomutase